MPLSSAESLVPIDVSTGLETPETELRLAHVARRLNRLTLQRALYRCVAVALLAASALAACAAWLSPGWFRGALASLTLFTLLVVVLSLRAAHARWAHALEAARWVEHKVPLEQRLLTLVSGQSDRGTRLWPELVADNRSQLPRWGGHRLGIAPVPANVFLLLLALVAAWLFLVPWYDEARSALALGGATVAPRGDDAESGEGGQGRAAAGPRAVIEGAGAEASPGQVKLEGAGGGAIAELQSDLAESFSRSIGGSAVLRDSARPGTGDDSPTKERGAVAESGLGKTKAEEGGRTPDEQLARREQDDGTGQTVSRSGADEQPEGAAMARTGSGKKGVDADGKQPTQAQGGGKGGKAQPGGDSPAEGPMAIGTEKGDKKHSGGGGAGSAKATEALLADKPLTLSGGRHSARFSLMLGGASGNAGSGGPKSMIAQPRSRIAEGERGPQEADHAVRHEEIPAEYETVVKRIFKREP